MGQAILKQNNKRIILFDGVCNLCNGFVQFVIKRDLSNTFHFASLQSEFAQKVIQQHPELKNVDAVIFLNEGEILIKSDAAIAIAQHLPFWKWSRILLIFPKFLRDGVYDLIAKYRYRILGKKDSCMVPSQAIKHKFIS